MDTKAMGKLWLMLVQSYGHRFVEQYGAVPNSAWSAAMGSIPEEAGAHAFKALMLSGSGFPPTLPEFISKAREYRPPQAQSGDRPVVALKHASEIDPGRRKRLRRQMFEALYGPNLPQRLLDRIESDPEDWLEQGSR